MKAIFQTLREGRYVRDQEFDQVFPENIRALSGIHWTPIEVARRAAELLVVKAGSRVLDVGSGCGKFCLVGALTTNGEFHGVEQRPHLVQLAKDIAASFEVQRAEYIHGDIRSIDWNQFDGFYLYNPFIENIYPDNIRMDQSVEYSEQSYVQLIQWVQRKLNALPIGARVVTYHGFGGDMPPSYSMRFFAPVGGDFLRLWVKDQ